MNRLIVLAGVLLYAFGVCPSPADAQYINIPVAQQTTCISVPPSSATLSGYWSNAPDGSYHSPNGQHDGSCNWHTSDFDCGHCQGTIPFGGYSRSTYQRVEVINDLCVSRTWAFSPSEMYSDCSTNHGNPWHVGFIGKSCS